MKSEGKTTHLYDLWLLGFVFLEVLVWAVFDAGKMKTFSTDRLGRGAPDSHADKVEDDAVWVIRGDGVPKLRDSVDE